MFLDFIEKIGSLLYNTGIYLVVSPLTFNLKYIFYNKEIVDVAHT